MHLVTGEAPRLRSINISDLALNTTLFYAVDLPYVALEVGVSAALFGILTFLVVVALVFLIRKGFSHAAVRILLPSTLLLYGSTALFMAALAGHVSSIDRLVAHAHAGLFSDSDAYPDAALEAFEAGVLRHSWMMTFALGINLLVGDSIVWWRVCAVWIGNRAVYCLGPLLIVLIFALGVETVCGEQECLHPPDQPQTLLHDKACVALSFVLNVLATTLIGYKAWVHRRLLRGHFNASRGGQQSRVLNALALLVESGTIYCLLLTIVIAYQVTPAVFPTPGGVHQNAFLRAIAVYTCACFIPVIAIYPVLIIVIVALGWSPIEHAISDAGDTAHPGAATLSDVGGPYPSMLAMRRDPNRATILPGRITVLADMDTDADTASAQRCIQHDDEDSTVAVAVDVEPETKQGAVTPVVRPGARAGVGVVQDKDRPGFQRPI